MVTAQGPIWTKAICQHVNSHLRPVDAFWDNVRASLLPQGANAQPFSVWTSGSHLGRNGPERDGCAQMATNGKYTHGN